MKANLIVCLTRESLWLLYCWQASSVDGVENQLVILLWRFDYYTSGLSSNGVTNEDLQYNNQNIAIHIVVRQAIALAIV